MATFVSMSKLIAIVLSFSVSLSAMAHAQMADVKCDDSARLRHSLTQVLGAERQGIGLRDPDTTLEIWVTHASGDWVIVQNYANGTSCIVAMGAHWEDSAANPA